MATIGKPLILSFSFFESTTCLLVVGQTNFSEI